MLIELKDGDTVIIGTTHHGDFEYYDRMIRALSRGTKDVMFFTAAMKEHSISVYRITSVPAPVEEHDGWFPFDSAPRDGQEIDVWIESRGRVPSVSWHEIDFKTAAGVWISAYGKPTHWRYPPKGPKS